MSPRLMRTLLKLYPRRIRNRYGEELLDLQSELEAQGDLSRTRLIGDMLAGALVVRPARHRARLVAGAVFVIAGLATAVTIITTRGTDPVTRASRPQAQLSDKSLNAVPAPCFVAAGSSCSLVNPSTSVPVSTGAPPPDGGPTSSVAPPACTTGSTGAPTSPVAPPASPTASTAAP